MNNCRVKECKFKSEDGVIIHIEYEDMNGHHVEHQTSNKYINGIFWWRYES